MQLASTPAKLTARAAQRLQACIHAVELALRELDRIGLSFESGIHRQSALQLPYMGTISHITKMHCKSTSIVLLLTISFQHDDAGLLAFEALQGLPGPARGTHGSLKVAAHVLVKPWFTAPPPCTFHCFVRKLKKTPIEDTHLVLAPIQESSWFPSASAFPLLHVEASNKSIQPRFNL